LPYLARILAGTYDALKEGAAFLIPTPTVAAVVEVWLHIIDKTAEGISTKLDS